LTIGFWNIENLYDIENGPNKNDDEFALNGRKNVTQKIYDLKIKHSAEVLSDLNVDVLGLCEVENMTVLKDLNKAYGERNYNIVHYESPDKRGLDNALMYDENRFSVLASRPIPNILKNGNKIRDILYVKGEYRNEILHLFINHWPSNYGGKERAIPKRRSTAKLIMSEVSLIQQTDRFAEIILLGDFNENPDEKNIELLREIGLNSLMRTMIGEPGVGTYVSGGEDYFYDQIILNNGLQDEKKLTIVHGSTYILDLPKYRHQDGKYKHFPFRFWDGNKLLAGYSDHLAIKVQITKN
jgi:predicted extracellular nuclease